MALFKSLSACALDKVIFLETLHEVIVVEVHFRKCLHHYFTRTWLHRSKCKGGALGEHSQLLIDERLAELGVMKCH